MAFNEWKDIKLLDILSSPVRNGYSPNSVDETTGYVVLGLGALTDNKLNSTQVKNVEFTDKVKKSQLKSGDFLISRSNTPEKVGRSILFRGEISNCSYPDLMMKFRIDESIADLDFIEAVLQSPDKRQYFSRCAAGSSSTMVKITKSVVENTQLTLPTLLEQKRISKILSTWDKAIVATEKLLKLSKQQKNSLAQQFLTGKSRFIEFESEWNKVKVSDLLSVRNEKKVPTQDVPLFSLTIEKGITAKSARYNREFLVKNSKDKKYKLVKPKDIVYNPANLRWGAINYNKLEHSVVVSPIYEVLYINDLNKYNLEFIAQALMSNNQIARFAAMTEGTLTERMAVKIIPFLSTKLDIPSTLNEQQKISAVLTNADNEIELLERQLADLKQEKKALMQQLLTGKRRVKIKEKEVA
jgi:type I restriction enzyme S subunit